MYLKILLVNNDIQYDRAYVDLLIETAEGITNQRDALLAQGMSEEDAKEALDFSPYEQRFTDGSPYMAAFFDAWFKQPFTDSIFKALSGEPMVDPSKRD